MADIPAQYIKDAPVDWDGEILAGMGRPVMVCGYAVPPLTFGVMQLLEMIDSRMVKAPAAADPLDGMRALYIVANRESAADAVAGFLPHRDSPPAFDDRHNWTEFDCTCASWCHRHCRPEPMTPAAMERLTMPAFAGYAMLPESGGGGSLYLFGEDAFVAALLTCEGLGVSPFDVRWRLPLATLGHVAAARARAAGVKGIARPKDAADMREQFRRFYEREDAGMLHPWQVDRPNMFRPSPRQMAARYPGVVEDFNAAVMAFQAKREAARYG